MPSNSTRRLDEAMASELESVRWAFHFDSLAASLLFASFLFFFLLASFLYIFFLWCLGWWSSVLILVLICLTLLFDILSSTLLV